MTLLTTQEFMDKFGMDLKKPLPRPAVVDLGALAWCQPCKILHPLLQDLEQEYKGIDFYEVDVDTEQTLAQDLNVSGIPTMYYLKGEGTVDMTVGLLTKKGLKDRFDALLTAQ